MTLSCRKYVLTEADNITGRFANNDVSRMFLVSNNPLNYSRKKMSIETVIFIIG